MVVGACNVALAGWIDPMSPDHARRTRGSRFTAANSTVEEGEDGEYELVFSDEFEVEGRRFDDGFDPRWTAVDKNDYTNMALHYYHANRVTTTNGVLNITTLYKPTEFLSAEDEKGFVEMKRRRKGFSSGLIQSWNKFCFTGGIFEVRARLPGKGNTGGLWPAMWLLGSLARATYVGTTDWIWPWSYDKCDRERQKTQEINACEPTPHYGLDPYTGRGAPEIDLLEAMPGSGTLNYGLQKPYFSASYQVAPGKLTNRPVEGKMPDKGQWYEDGISYGVNTTINTYFYGEELTHVRKGETYTADAISANRHLTSDHFENFHNYRLEWSTKEGDEYLRWFLDGDFVFEVLPETLAFTGAKMPDEPMHILLNTAVSSTWGFPAPCPVGCDCACYDCGKDACNCAMPTGFCDMLPAFYEVDYVRIYQRPTEPSEKIGCSTDNRPTKRYIEGHRDRYFDPYNSEKKPLKDVPSGGGACKSDSDCAAGVVGGGTCQGPPRKKTCVCTDRTTGPNCQAFTAFDDHNYEHTWNLAMCTPFIPATLLRVVVALALGTSALVFLRIKAQLKIRKIGD